MTDVKILDSADLPEENEGKCVTFNHPYTDYPYSLGVYHVKGRYFAVTDRCRLCGNSLTKGKLNGMYASCVMEEHPWNVKTGICKFNRTMVAPTYRVVVKEDGLYIEI